MNTKKHSKTSETRPHAADDLTIVIGSGSANRETPDAGSAKPGDSATSLDAPMAVPAAAMVHDLVGFVVIALPEGLRKLIGDEAMRATALELEDRKVLVIVREPGVVGYVHLPITVLEMELAREHLQGEGLVLKDITGSFLSKTTDAATPEERAAKARAPSKARSKIKPKAAATAKEKEKEKANRQA